MKKGREGHEEGNWCLDGLLARFRALPAENAGGSAVCERHPPPHPSHHCAGSEAASKVTSLCKSEGSDSTVHHSCAD